MVRIFGLLKTMDGKKPWKVVLGFGPFERLRLRPFERLWAFLFFLPWVVGPRVKGP